MFITYSRYNPLPLTEFGNITAGHPPFTGQSVTRPPRLARAFLRRVARRYRQVPPEWGMLGGTIPMLPVPALTPLWVKPRVTGRQAARLRRANLPPDSIATIGPGLTAGPPFTPTAYGPRITPRELLLRQRHYRQIDCRAAMSGMTARTQGSFVGAKLGFLTVEGRRSVASFTVTPHRTGSLTVQ